MDWSEESLLPGCVTVGLAVAVAVCALLVLHGAGDHDTTRVWGPNSSTGSAGTTMREGAGGWPAAAFLSALIVLGAMAHTTATSVVGRFGIGAVTAAVAASLFGLTAVVAGWTWRQLVAEREGERDYVLDIAGGLPVTVFASAIGSALAFVLIGVLLARRGRNVP